MTDDPSWTDKIAAIAGGVTCLATLATGLIIWRQLRAVRITGQASISESLSSQSIEIIKLLSLHPEVRPYFYEDKLLGDDEQNYVQVKFLAEIICNFLEHICLQRENMPKSAVDSWMSYVREAYVSSRVVRDFIAEHRVWYSPVLLDFLEVPASPEITVPWYRYSADELGRRRRQLGSR